MRSIARLRAATVAGLLATLLPIGAETVRPAGASAQSLDGTGTVSTGLLLRRLDGVKRVLMIAAHPDDEDTSLLTTLARGQGVETAYLSLTRGDGGQNLLGPELWEGLGIVRTGELMAARELDGGRQFFTRAFDYGYSKSAEEALTFWSRDEVVGDAVWVIRTFRPHVIVTVWRGTAADGHGQHQASGIIAREAFAAAGDPARFPEQLERGVEAWAPSKLYQLSWRRFAQASAEPDGSIDVPTGIHDPLLGRSLHQLSMESRSQHRSQDMGAAQPLGPNSSGVTLVESRVGEAQEIFAGIDTTLTGLADRLRPPAAEAARRHLRAYRSALHDATDAFGLEPGRIVPDLQRARVQLDSARQVGRDATDVEYRSALSAKAGLLDRAIIAAAGIVFDVRAADDLVVPGQAVEVRAQLWNGGAGAVVAAEVGLQAPAGWTVRMTGAPERETVEPGELSTWTYQVTLPEDADLSRLYFLRQPLDGASYRWPDEPELWGLPRDPAPVRGTARFGYRPVSTTGSDGEQPSAPRVEAGTPWRFVGVDPASGEFERPVLVVPAVSVSVQPAGVTWPQSRAGSRDVTVVLRGEADGGSRGTVTVEAPAGWNVEPARREFELAEAGAERSMAFRVSPTGSMSAGRHAFRVRATTVDGRVYDEGYALVDYEHIERAALFSPAVATVSVVPVTVSDGLRVGYVMGSGDDGPEAIRQMGAEVELLDEARVRSGDFAGFSTIVLGVRAYETRPDLQAAAAQLLDFARGGGTVVVQYNRGPLGSLAPYALEIGRGSPRVSDETAPVRMLDASAPVFATPNRIEADDFDGWVQERGLYFAAEWDERWVELLELADPGEPPRHGALLAASVGDGVFVYTALSFFRQWAGQVPGAYRLFANLISLDPAEWQAFEQAR